MMPTCSRCGRMLPPRPADPAHPDRCLICVGQDAAAAAARPAAAPAAGPAGGRPAPPAPATHDPAQAPPPARGVLPPGVASPGATAPPLPPGAFRSSTAPRLRIGGALLVGIATAAVAGVLWWGAIVVTELQFPYLALVLGFLVGQGVLVGARRGGFVPGLIAGVASLASLAATEYFVERSLAISRFHVDLPLWQGLEFAREVVTEAAKEDPVRPAFWLAAGAAAVVTAGSRHREPAL